MSENIFENEIIPPQRPVFLKVLCMLTFIGSGYGLINSAVTYLKADSISKIFVEVKTKMNDDLARNKKARKPEKVFLISNIMSNASVMTSPENLRKTAMGNSLTSVLCLLGAFLMWHLRRVGFFIYTLGTIISIILPFYMFGSNF